MCGAGQSPRRSVPWPGRTAVTHATTRADEQSVNQKESCVSGQILASSLPGYGQCQIVSPQAAEANLIRRERDSCSAFVGIRLTRHAICTHTKGKCGGRMRFRMRSKLIDEYQTRTTINNFKANKRDSYNPGENILRDKNRSRQGARRRALIAANCALTRHVGCCVTMAFVLLITSGMHLLNSEIARAAHSDSSNAAVSNAKIVCAVQSQEK